MLRIAIMGTRGIPASYGGFETFAEELGARLVARGHEVVVYGRSNVIDHPSDEYRGIRLVVLPTISHKHLDTLANTFLSTLHVAMHRVDVVLMPNTGNAIVSWIPRVFGIPVLMNVDGLEWRRRKWGRGARAFLKMSEWLATWMPTAIVTDAKVIQDHYQAKYGKSAAMVPYGASVGRKPDAEAVAKYGLEPERYLLYVSRLEPENNAAMVIEAYMAAGLDVPLVVVGDAPYARDYIASLKAMADERVRFLGFVFGEDYRHLQRNAYAYIHATEVGGTHPALVEAMGFGNLVLVYGTPENVEVVGDAAIVFRSAEELSALMADVLHDPSLVATYRGRAMERVRERYDWDAIAAEYEKLLSAILRRKR